MPSKGKKVFNTTGKKNMITVDPSLPAFENEPFFLIKAEKVKTILKTVGLPKMIGDKK